MTGTTAKIVLAVGLTALLTAVVLIAAFLGFMYFRTQDEPRTVPDHGSLTTNPSPVSLSRRKKGPIVVEANEITEIHFHRSSMRSTASIKPAAFFGNINVQNFVSQSTTLTFFATGIAQKIEVSERTVDGKKVYGGPTKYELNIGRDAFEQLTAVMVENDFANEPDSLNITSLPERVELTVSYGSNKKLIKASNTDQDSLEMAAMLKAIDLLAARTDWRAGQK